MWMRSRRKKSLLWLLDKSEGESGDNTIWVDIRVLWEKKSWRGVVSIGDNDWLGGKDKDELEFAVEENETSGWVGSNILEDVSQREMTCSRDWGEEKLEV